MRFRDFISAVTPVSIVILYVMLPGCSPGRDAVWEDLIHSLSRGGCQGCDCCIPDEAEGEDKPPVEGEVVYVAEICYESDFDCIKRTDSVNKCLVYECYHVWDCSAEVEILSRSWYVNGTYYKCDETEGEGKISPKDICCCFYEGDNTIILETETRNGTYTASVTITLVDPWPADIGKAYFEPSVTEGPAPLTVEFNNMSHCADAYSPFMGGWNFGDGNWDGGCSSATHVYTEPGAYTVCFDAGFSALECKGKPVDSTALSNYSKSKAMYDPVYCVDIVVTEPEGEPPVEGEGEVGAERPSLTKYYAPFVDTTEPNSPSYTLPIAVRDIPNYEWMDRQFGLADAKELVSKNGFAVLEHDWTRHFPEAEENADIIKPYEFMSESGIPIFITSDTLLHLYHVQFDESLKEVEETEFADDITDLTASLRLQAQALYETSEGNLREAARRNVIFLSVAEHLVSESADAPKYAADTVAAELALIEAHTGFSASPLFIYEEDYSQYIPRGHYTRSEILKRYFKGLMWYGRLSFLLKGHEDWGPAGKALISPYDADIQTLQAVLLARALDEVTVPDGRTGREVWDRMYAVTAFYVGLADDLTPVEYMHAANTVFGAGFNMADLAEPDALFKLRKELAKLRLPEIYGGTGNIILTPPITPESLNDALAKTQGMRFMGQRFIPDSYMFQHLVFPEVRDYTGTGQPFTLGSTGGSLSRCYPRGLDVMAVMGSQRALDLLVEEGDTEYVDFDKVYGELQAEFAAFDESDWNRNLYWGWLYALRALIQPTPEGYPSFMRTTAWEDKALNAALASWTALRHDTILYAKQSYTPRETAVPDTPPGYVEPVPAFFGQLLAITRMTRDGLSDLDALSTAAANRLDKLAELLETLIGLARKQLSGEALDEEDTLFIKGFAEQLESTVLGVSEEGVKTTLVADVHTHTAEGKVVEEGVGEVGLLVVACPTSSGEVFLAAGPVLSYYEFKHPMNDRLTDEAWRALLASEAMPARPAWIKDIMP